MNECIYCGGHDCPECDMTTPERSVEDVIDEIKALPHSQAVLNPNPLSLGDVMVSRNRVIDIVQKALEAERQKRDEMVESEREDTKEILRSVSRMVVANATTLENYILGEMPFTQTNENK